MTGTPKTPDDIDVALLRRIVDDRDMDAMKEIYQTYQAKLSAFLYRITTDRNVIEDVYNEVMMTVWNKGHQFQGNSKVSTWVYAIAQRRCLNILRKSYYKNIIISDDEEMLDRLAGEDGTDVTDEIPDLVSKAVSKLPPKQRMVVELCYFDGLSYEEISQIMQCPVNTVKTRMFHAKSKLEKIIKKLSDANVPDASNNSDPN